MFNNNVIRIWRNTISANAKKKLIINRKEIWLKRKSINEKLFRFNLNSFFFLY